MKRPKRKEAACSGVVPVRGKSENGIASKNGLGAEDSALSPCFSYGIIARSHRSMGCRGRSLLKDRRIFAGPIAWAYGSVFGENPNHGLIAPIDFMGAPCGELSGSPRPISWYFLHPHGVARPVGRTVGIDNSKIGARP